MDIDEEDLDGLIEQIRKTREIIRERDECRYTSKELIEINDELQKQMEHLRLQNNVLKIGLEEKEKLSNENTSLRKQVDSFKFLVTTPDYMDTKTISDEFRISVKSAKKEIRIVSPWITHLIPEIENIAPKGVKFKIITRIDEKDIGTRSFDEDIARRLIRLGRGSIKKLNSLHAKMVIVDGKKAIISSANITRAGLGDDDADIVNYEAGVVVQGDYVKDAIAFFDAMWNKADVIDDKTLNNIINEAKNEQHSLRG